jgi:hypothetical protein
MIHHHPHINKYVRMSSPVGDGDGSGVEDDGWNDVGDSNDEDLQRQRMKANVILSSVCGTLSIIGSSLILFSIYRTRVLSFRSIKQQQQQQQQLPSFADNHKNNNDVAKESRTSDDPPPLRYSRWTAPPPLSPRQLPRQQQLPNGTFQRLLIGTATFDILFSFGWAFGPIPIPSSTGAYGAHGNQTTCTIQSLLLQFGTTSFAYSTCLMIYYALVICGGGSGNNSSNKNNNTRVRRYEPWMHLYCTGFHSAVAISGSFFDVYHPTFAESQCWIGEPTQAGNNDDDDDGNQLAVVLYGFVLRAVPQILYLCICLACLSAIGYAVWKQYRRSRRFQFPTITTTSTKGTSRRPITSPSRSMSTEAASSLTTSISTPAITSTATTTTKINNNSSSVAKREMKLTVTQCFLYGIVFINSTIWPSIVVILITVQSDDNPDDGRSYILSNGQLFLAIVVHTFYPLQGFFYFCVYIRPRYLTVMRLWDDQQARQEEHQLVTTNGQVEPLSSSSVETPPPPPQSQLRLKRNRLHALYHAVVYPINT